MQDRIIQVAAREIQTKGLKFTMAELARQAGVSTKTLYGYYTSKEQLIEEIIVQTLKEMQEKEKEIMGQEEIDLAEKLRQVLVHVPNGFGNTHPLLWQELKRYYPEQWKLVEDCLEEGWDNVRSLLEKGMEQGQFERVSIPVFLQMYIAAIKQLMDRQFVAAINMTVSDALDAMVEILLHGIVRRHTATNEEE
ncbi:TetR/AcrR family transcriptional regulator [Brevibacillus ruminantium]|uniref:TetR/AcrR family transcriptional regulator n=1 Tax=Brevibacillus ruminantium TaxID=2950604 RepID=A0ABY4WCR2_9BACL|nr:TetR/AcrR family transcriptional regulator [Brevibacillus ruminantium]USG64962.1 TetR/AcrR family transcriptional regulator [Brevibacillus ruminantium]